MFQRLKNASVEHRRVLVRVDFNVPFGADGKTIADDFRIRAVVPTIQWLCEHGARVVLMSHLGRPSGDDEKQLSLKPIARHLSKLLKKSVTMANDAVGDGPEDDVLHMQDGDVLLLENLRFHDGEKKDNAEFAARLARLGELYINEAFGVSHRAHASVSAITRLLPSYAGPILEKELRILSGALEKPERPLALLMGGAKVETKLPVIENFLHRADWVMVGGALINTILAANGKNVGASRVERDMFLEAKRLSLANKRLYLPSDVVVSPNPHGKKGLAFRQVQDVRAGEMILDIGPETIGRFGEIIREAATVIWNGPMGLFEIPTYAHGTEAMARAVAGCEGYSIVGGGDTGIIISRLGLEKDIDHISTGGGAMLEFLAGKRLPGLEALGYYTS